MRRRTYSGRGRAAKSLSLMPDSLRRRLQDEQSIPGDKTSTSQSTTLHDDQPTSGCPAGGRRIFRSLSKPISARNAGLTRLQNH